MTYTRLISSDLRSFDKEARALVLEAMDHGWIGTISNKGHAILRAPDGVTTNSISPNSQRARSGKNARAAFDRWLKAQMKEKEKEMDKKRWECPECDEVFDTRQGLGAHSKKHIPKEMCTVCGKSFMSIANHMWKAHKIVLNVGKVPAGLPEAVDNLMSVLANVEHLKTENERLAWSNEHLQQEIEALQVKLAEVSEKWQALKDLIREKP